MKLEFTKIGFESANMLGREITEPHGKIFSKLTWNINGKEVRIQTPDQSLLLMKELAIAARKPAKQRMLIVEIPNGMSDITNFVRVRIETALAWTRWHDVTMAMGSSIEHSKNRTLPCTEIPI